jgi:DNA-binding NarL/FixJ family response regulator
MDWELPGRPPADALAAARASAPAAYIIVLLREGGPWQAARSAGANACLERGGPPGELLAAVRQARAWRAAVDDAKPTDMKGEQA